jgi:hypothetical protein
MPDFFEPTPELQNEVLSTSAIAPDLCIRKLAKWATRLHAAAFVKITA